MKIAIFLPNLHGGGAERVGVNLANGLVQRGYLVDMVLMRAVGQLLDDLDPRVRIIDLTEDRARWVWRPLLGYLRKESPDGMIANMWPLTFLALWLRATFRLRTKIVVVEHTQWSVFHVVDQRLQRMLVQITMHLWFPTADGVVVVSKGSAKDLVEFAGLRDSQVDVIYNPIFDPMAERPVAMPVWPHGWCLGAHKRILAVGTLKKEKDFATLIDAFSMLVNDRGWDARLLILGEGECRHALEEQARMLGIAERIEMPGFINQPTAYYAAADLFVLSSHLEGFGNVLVEAMAAGTPVVSTDCPSGPREILGDGAFGLLVPIGDVPALAKGMEESLSGEHDRMALMARAGDFSIDKAVDRYVELLNR